MQTGNTDFSYRNELDKACFQHDMAYGKSKDLPKRTQSDKVLRDKTFNIASDPKYGGYQRGLASMVYKFVLLVKLKTQFRGLMKSPCIKMSQYFPKPFQSFRGNIKININSFKLCNKN